jgi:hypothetical protein
MSGRHGSNARRSDGRGAAGRGAAARLIALMLVTVAACGAPPSASPPSSASPSASPSLSPRPSSPPRSTAPGTAALGAAAQRIDTLIGDAACRTDADCATVGIGWLACGGPQSWRAWSRTATQAAALDAAVAAHRALRQKEIERTGEMSLCALVPDPGAFCDGAAAGAGHCRVRRDGRGGAAVR